MTHKIMLENPLTLLNFKKFIVRQLFSMHINSIYEFNRAYAIYEREIEIENAMEEIKSSSMHCIV